MYSLKKSIMKNRIILITGPKHSGKSLCAAALGRIAGTEAVDLDDLVEKQTGETPGTLFFRGPEIFMKAEVLALASYIRQPEQDNGIKIIAAGGGIVDNAEAMAMISLQREIVRVYLEVSAETAWQRILRTATSGGLPSFLNTENPRETHLAIHERRSKAYKEQAKIIIAAEGKSPEDIAREIMGRLQLLDIPSAEI